MWYQYVPLTLTVEDAESAVSDGIGKGAQIEAASDLQSNILAKLFAQRREVIARCESLSDPASLACQHACLLA